jgi:glycosyltransferase involved in cell wall biosynthesis
VNRGSENPPDVSLVFETANDRPHNRIRFADVVSAWRRQTRADRLLEWIVVSSRGPTPLEERLLEGLPIRWLVRPELSYYQQKNAGIGEARGAFVAFADSDALPADDWLERALEVLERSDASVALVTGRTQYLPGPFCREMAVAQLPNQADHPNDTTHFLAHNVLLRADIVRSPRLFLGDSVRLGSDTYLAARLIEAGYRLRYDPSLRFTHNYSRHWARLYRTCTLTGYAYGSFQQHVGAPHPNRLRDFAGRVRVLIARWREIRRPLGIPFWRLPLSLLFFVAYSVAIGYGYEMAVRGKPKPFRWSS